MTKKDKLIYARYLKMSYEDAFAEGFAEGFAKGYAEESERSIRIIRESDIPEGVKERILAELSECLTTPNQRDEYVAYDGESLTRVCKVF